MTTSGYCMPYESQGIFAEGWEIDFRKEAKGITNQHAKSKKGRTPKEKRKADCQQCGKTFIVHHKSLGKYCSLACTGLSQRKNVSPSWVECSRCFAKAGIGMTTAARLLRTSKKTIFKVWKSEGIVRISPPSGEWRRYAQRAKSSVCGWWGNSETAAMWMQHYKEVFPDWGSLFRLHMTAEQKEKAKTKYHSLSDEEKKARNKRIHELRKARYEIDPIGRARQNKHSAEWKKKNPQKVRAYVKKSVAKRKIVDPGFKVQCNLRNRLKEIMGKVKRGGTEHRNNLTGCSTRQLADHLESTFKRGMTWKNYGTSWHVDHILPCASFDHTDPKQVAQCWHWTNLRALDAKKNMEKSDTITEPQMSLLLCAAL